MITADIRRKHLEQLNRFIQEEEIDDWKLHMWYHALRTQYAYEFIMMVRVYNEKFPLQKERLSPTYLEEAICTVNRHYTRVYETLATGNDQLLETNDFKWSAGVLQSLLKKQSREN